MTDGLKPEETFPNTQAKQGGTTRHGKKVLESGFTQPGYQEGSGGLTPENFLDNAPMKDEPHPHTGEDIFGGL